MFLGGLSTSDRRMRGVRSSIFLMGHRRLKLIHLRNFAFEKMIIKSGRFLGLIYLHRWRLMLRRSRWAAKRMSERA